MNPWKVQSIQDFNYFCCPECVYRSKQEIPFQEHALQNHEESKTFFHNVSDLSNLVKQEIFDDDHYYDQFSYVEPNDHFNNETISDPSETENDITLKKVKTELLPSDLELKNYYEKISEIDDRKSEFSVDSIENEQAFQHLKQKRNIIKEENQRKFQCKYCIHFYSVETSLKKHVTKCHSDIIHDDEICTEEVETKIHSCPKCNENFDDLLMVWFTLKF
jgi:hypothetical protein